MKLFISPSLLHQFNKCQRSILSRLDGDKYPNKPSTQSVLGATSHEVLEKIELFTTADNPIDFSKWFTNTWEEVIGRNFENFAKKWSPNVVTPPVTWKQYFNTKNVCRQMASEVHARRVKILGNQELAAVNAPRFKRLSEHKFSIDDLGIAGKPDLVLVNGETATIIDFKFGQKSEDNEGYAFQLHFYLILVEHELQVKVTKLMIRFGIGDERDIAINPKLIEKIRGEVAFAHKVIDSAELQAKPSLDNCRYCPVKPGCKEFLSSHIKSTGNYPLLVQGTLERISQTGDAFQTLELKPTNITESQKLVISRVPIGYSLRVGQLIVITDNLDFHSNERVDFQWNSSIYTID